jgi:titin
MITTYVGGVAQTSTVFNSAATTETVLGLANGTSYTFTVAATNSNGTGADSVPTAPIIVGAPLAPTSVKAVPGPANASTGSLTVSYVAAANNGATITKYTATCTSPGGGVTRSAVRNSATAGPIVVAGLTTKKSYTCRVTETNARATSAASAASAAVIVGTPGPPPKPTIVKTAAGSLKVSFTAPAANGAAITSYTATCTSSNGGITRSKSATASPITVTTLSAGKTYTCTARATNSRGTGPPSPPSSPATA